MDQVEGLRDNQLVKPSELGDIYEPIFLSQDKIMYTYCANQYEITIAEFNYMHSLQNMINMTHNAHIQHVCHAFNFRKKIASKKSLIAAFIENGCQTLPFFISKTLAELHQLSKASIHS